MGTFDYVNFTMPCPSCGAMIRSFQTKDSFCLMITVEPDELRNFYGSCRCGCLVEFSRPYGIDQRSRDKPLTQDQLEAMGFGSTVSIPSAPEE